MMNSISRLLDPRSVAIVGASPRGGRGKSTLLNLRGTGFAGDVFAINPRYTEVLGCPCFPSVDSLPYPVDCLLLAIGAEACCEVLEAAFERGIRAAVVLASGFGEGSQNEGRAERLRALGAKGMSICGPNCQGLVSITPGSTISVYSGRLPAPVIAGNVAFVSQSGGLSFYAFVPLMSDRKLGFRYVVSCGNQITTTVEDYMEAFVEDAGVSVIAAIIESIRNPQKLQRVAELAHARGKKMIFHHVGRSSAGRIMTQSHTGALVGDTEVLAAFLRRCGIVSIDDYDEFVEAMELFAVAPADCDTRREVAVISGSGGSAAIAADTLESLGMGLPTFVSATQERLRAVLPDFGTITNPLDGTGLMSDDAAVLELLLDAIASEDSRALIAVPVNAKETVSARDLIHSETVARAAQKYRRTIIAYQYSPLGGPLDPRIVGMLHEAHVPLLLGNGMAMRVLRYLPMAQEFRDEVLARQDTIVAQETGSRQRDGGHWSFLAAREALVASGIGVIAARLAGSEQEALSAFHEFGCPVALKAEAQGLLHKSDIGCVQLNCGDEAQVVSAYRSIVAKARLADFVALDGVLVQPMEAGVAEIYVGVLNDAVFGPAICLGLGGIFVEILKDIVTEIAPLSNADALGMIRRLRGAPLLFGARGRPSADVDALAAFLVRLSRFAVANAQTFRAIDLNPVIVKSEGQGVVAVDIAVEPALSGERRDRLS